MRAPARAEQDLTVDLHPRLQAYGPDRGWGWKVRLGHGGDEFGNCSWYLKTALFGVVVFPFPHFQLKVPVPEPGTHPWIDAVWWQGVPVRDEASDG
jgi:hypothetical protein